MIDPVVVAQILKSGASVNRIDDNGWSPIFLAACNQSATPVIFEMLIACGADVNLNSKSDGETLLDVYLSYNWENIDP